MDDQAGWRAWSGGWKSGEPPADWWLSTDGRWYPPGVQCPPDGPRWRGSMAEYRPREFAEAGTRSPVGVGVVTRAPADEAPAYLPRHAVGQAGPSGAQAEMTSLVRTTLLVLAAALVAIAALALVG